MRRNDMRYLNGYEEAGGFLLFSTSPAIPGGANPPLQKADVGNTK